MAKKKQHRQSFTEALYGSAGLRGSASVRVTIKKGWEGAGRVGTRLGPDVFVEQEWTPVLWDDEEDPDFFKARGLERKVERTIDERIADS